jgi:hypothetical protein
MTKRRALAACCLTIGLAHASIAKADQTYDAVSFYFAAHQDDWQLFMNPSAFQDVTSATKKVVFVHTTAGDAGAGIGNAGRRHPYYLARENGALFASRFMADSNKGPGTDSVSRPRFNGHELYRVSYENTVSYFLRVPDGNPGGTGYPHTGHQSLARLAHQDTDVLTAVDGSTTYHGWADLVATVRAIIDFERAAAPVVQLNVAETDPRLNPQDHSDHLMTAKAALDATAGMSCLRRHHYVEYATGGLPENLAAPERDLESSVYAVTAAGVRALDHSMNWMHYNKTFVGKNYFRVEEARGRCDTPAAEVSAAIR